MKKYEKIVSKMIKNFAEKGLIQCEKVPSRKIIDYLNYMGVAVIQANEQGNANFKLDDPTKEVIVSIVDKQWNLFKKTKVGYELVSFYENKNKMQEVVKNPEELDKFLSTVTSKKMIDELFVTFVKAGDLDSVKKLVEKKSPKIKPDVDMCVIAVEHNQPAILDYLFHKDKYQVAHKQSYMGIYTRKSMEYNAIEVFNYAIEKCDDPEKQNFLSHAIFYKLENYAYKLIDLGAKLEGMDSRVDKEFLETVTSYYNKKLVHDNLETELTDKPKKKSAKI